jgi:hypothetical protein
VEVLLQDFPCATPQQWPKEVSSDDFEKQVMFALLEYVILFLMFKIAVSYLISAPAINPSQLVCERMLLIYR